MSLLLLLLSFRSASIHVLVSVLYAAFTSLLSGLSRSLSLCLLTRLHKGAACAHKHTEMRIMRACCESKQFFNGLTHSLVPTERVCDDKNKAGSAERARLALMNKMTDNEPEFN
jgi:hypothetical protein